MSVFSKNLLKQLDAMEMTQKDLAQKTDITPATISRYISGDRNPSAHNVKKIAEVLKVSVDQLLNDPSTSKEEHPTIDSSKSSFSPKLTSKDEKDIALKLESILNSINTDDGLMLYNNDLDEETKELLIASIERTLRQAKLIAKEKFTPKKYRN